MDDASHLSVFFIRCGFRSLFWPISKQTGPYASRQVKQAFFFHLIINSIELLVALLLFASNFMSVLGSLMTPPDSSTAPPSPLGYFLSIWFLAMLIGIMNMGLVIYGVVQGYQGKRASLSTIQCLAGCNAHKMVLCARITGAGCV